MSLDLGNEASSVIATPASGYTRLFVDTIDKSRKAKNDAGYINSYQNAVSLTSQSVSAATRTYIAGTNVKISSNKLQAGSMFRWKFSMTKTAAGVATSTFDIAVGTNGTTSDTARVSFTKPAGTAAADEAIVEIIATVRSIGAAGVMVGQFTMLHNGNTAGHATIPCVVVNTVSSGFDMTVANLQVGVCLTSGASDAITIQLVQTEWWDV